MVSSGTFRRPDPFDAYDVRLVTLGEAIFIVVLAAVSCWGRVRALIAGCGLARWLRIPLILATLNAIVLSVVKLPPGEDYYLLKTNLHPLALPLAASVVAVAALAAAIADARAARTSVVGRRTALALLVVMALALVVVARGFRVYWPSFVERAVGRPPFKTLLVPSSPIVSGAATHQPGVARTITRSSVAISRAIT